jgi:hypothetical protein
MFFKHFNPRHTGLFSYDVPYHAPSQYFFISCDILNAILFESVFISEQNEIKPYMQKVCSKSL